MKRQVLLDTGPLVAMINRRDSLHAWTTEQLARLEPPFLTCEPVLSESCFLLRRVPGGVRAVMELVIPRTIKVSFGLDEETVPVAELLARYGDVPMSLADACLVRMAELYDSSVVLTFDSDFKVYRKNRRQIIPIIMPDDA